MKLVKITFLCRANPKKCIYIFTKLLARQGQVDSDFR